MIQCPQCDQLNEPFFKFCLMCGATLSGGAAVAQKPSRAESVRPRPEQPSKSEPAKKTEVAPVPAPVEPAPAPVAAAPEASPAPTPESSMELAAARTEPALLAVEPTPEPEPAREPEPVPEFTPEPAAEPTPESAAPEPASQPAADDTFAAPVEPSAVSSPDDDEELGEARGALADAPMETPAPAPAAVRAPEPAAVVAPVAAPAEPVRGGRRRTRFTLVVIRDDATDGERVALDEGIFTVGREGAQLEFADDVYMDPLHASLDVTDGSVTVVDQGSVNGVFVQIHTAVPLPSGGEVRVGQQLLRFEDIDAVRPLGVTADGSELLGAPVPSDTWGRLVEVVGPDFESAAFLLHKPSILIGREKGDITFPDDGYVSGRHARIFREGTRTLVEDLGSSNGTYLRAIGPTPIRAGAMLLLGQQLFRLDG